MNKMERNYHDGRDDRIERLEAQMEQALSKGNPFEYYTACVGLGLPESGIANKLLFQQGKANYLENIASESQNLKPVETSVTDRDYWSKIASIALPRFSELQQGEHVTTKEMKDRLRRLRKAGYEVENYSGMKNSELWNYLAEIRKDVRSKAEQYCPDTLVSINASNIKAVGNRNL